MIEIEQVRRILSEGTLLIIGICLYCCTCCAQVTIEGNLQDDITGEGLIGASIIMKGTTIGTVTDFDGNFVLDVPRDPPFTLVFSYIGFNPQEREITNASDKLKIRLEEQSFTTTEVVIKESRISEKVKESPQTIESLDIIAIKETPSANFYDGLGNLKGVDLTTASLGFTVINTRGFNSTSPVRSLQTIDGVDNQAPGLNFSLGNFLGAPELDVQKVELVVGANSAYYGPNAFNGVIAIVTRDPFIHQGLSLQFKAGERALLDGGFRFAHAFGERGKEKLAFKVNFNYMQANDWEADNFDEVFREDPADLVGVDNPGGYDAVNIYGDEHIGRQSFSFDHTSPGTQISFPGVGVVHRRGYREEDLVDYGTKNLKLGGAIHYKIQDDVQIIGSMLYGSGTTVYQGDNRLSLRGIQFFQPKLEIQKRNKWFLRGYYTKEDDGDTFDSFFTAIKLVEASADGVDWITNYRNFWRGNPPSNTDFDFDFENEVEDFPGWAEAAVPGAFDSDAAEAVLANNQAQLVEFHQITQDATNSVTDPGDGIVPFYEPGTARFDSLFNAITTSFDRNPDTDAGEIGGTGFFDQSALWHIHGEYKFNPAWADITVGGNFRQFRPDSRGTIFSDTTELIRNNEFGSYIGLEKKVLDNRLKLSASLRADKNENFDLLFSPAISGVYTLTENSIVRLAVSSAIRNPTLTDQFFFYDVGPAILLGNQSGVENLVTTDSFIDFLNQGDPELLDFFDVDPIQPEKVISAELGLRTTISSRVYLDASYYLNSYTDFIGFLVGADLELIGTNFRNVQFFRVATNSDERVFSQGFALGANYYFGQYYSLNGNYSWNQLTTQVDDPIIPAFNTPEHKFNIGINGRNMVVDVAGRKIRGIGFNFNYKWVQGFLFEGSPQFTGEIPTYALLDGQVNYKVPRINTTFKIGATNILNNAVFQVYGGPAVGRLAYASVSVELKK